jgi:hypothetical protein
MYPITTAKLIAPIVIAAINITPNVKGIGQCSFCSIHIIQIN